MKQIGLGFSTTLILGLLLVSQVTTGARSDPTRPVDFMGLAGGAVQADLIVSSILFAEHRRVAVINGESFGEGDYIGPYQVKKIDVQEVVLAKTDEEMVLPLGGVKIEKRYLEPSIQDELE